MRSSHYSDMTAFSKSEWNVLEGNAVGESGNHKGDSLKCEKEAGKKELSNSEISKNFEADVH